MERVTRGRAIFMAILLLGVIMVFGFRLYDMQVIETGGSTDNTSTFTTYTVVKAARGDILDRNGNLLVSNRASYNLVINHYVLLTAKGTNNYLYQLAQCCKTYGIEYTEHFPISKERPFTYTSSELNAAWQGYFQTYLAYMGGLDSDISAPLLIQRLRERYSIPAEWTDEEARLVIGMRYEMDLRACVSSLANYVFLEDVSDEALSAIMELNIPGLNVEASTVREYNTQYAAHILGYVGSMNAEQWKQYKDDPDYSMDSKIGQAGFEMIYEEYLHGVDGLREDTVTTSGELVSSRYITEPKAGSNVEVSIDINLQRAAEDSMADLIATLRASEDDGSDAEGGAVVVMDVKTGQVLVCASYPTYDLSTFFEDYDQILEQDYDPLFNRALMGTYPPGSTYKMSMVIAAINSGIINSADPIYDHGIWDQDGSGRDKYKNFQLYCLQYTNYGMIHEYVDAAKALQRSCNYYFYELGDKIGLSAMDSTAKGLGLGESTGIELFEYVGHRANAETKKKLYSGDEAGWYQADQVTAAIGQSDNRFTPMQLCVYASTLANRGTRYSATFLNRVVSSDYRSLIYENEVSIKSTMEISDDAYLAYTTGMWKVANEQGGTAYSTFKNYPIEIAAKTGTAQHDGSKTASDNGAFVCYAPYDEPEIAIAIYGEKAGHGSTLAQIAKSILDVYFEVGQIGDVTTNENTVS